MKLNAPKQATFMIALILLVLGLVAKFIVIPFITVNAFWFVVASAVLLILACMITGL